VSSAFDRTRRWLAGFGDPDELAAALARTRVEIVLVDPKPDAEIAAALTATLLLRLDEASPILHVVAPHTRGRSLPRLDDQPLVEALAAAHHGFDSLSRLVAAPADAPVIRLVFGCERDDGVTVASSGWRAAIGATPDGPAGNPIAASFAGLLAAVEATKAMLTSAGVEHRRLRPWTGVVSLWDHGLPGTDGPSIHTAVDLDGVAFVGAGGIASATAWVLALLELTGAPRAVDKDCLDGPNLNRHLTAGHAEAADEMRKVDVFGELLDAAGANTNPVFARWQELPQERRTGVDVVVISVDHEPTRRDVQLDLPRLILNAGNADTGLYRVTRHDFLNGACLRCISRGDERSLGPEESAARRLGLELSDIMPLLSGDVPLPEILLARAVITDEERERIRGLRARHALGVVCGQFSPLPNVPALSMPALSAAPGVVLASELVKARMAAPAPSLDRQHNVLAAGILAGPHPRWISHRAKQPTCECTDDIYRRGYAKTWAR
jgi:hypothetical protein